MAKQYDTVGQRYIHFQRAFFHAREDAARKYLYAQIGRRKIKILDLGCGAGPDIVVLEKMGASVFGIDSSRLMIAEAKKVVQHPERIHYAPLTKLPFPNATFDCVTSRFVLHYLRKPNTAYSEIHRVLKRGGTFTSVVSHPLEDWYFQKPRRYGSQQNITVPIYNRSVQLHFPSHTFADYFTSDFFKYFDIKNLHEEGLKTRENPSIPGFLGWSVTKR